jgi:hypothetical protein
MARKTVTICDACELPIEDGTGATLRLNYDDARRGSKQADLCANCAAEIPGHSVARRGRKPKETA